MDEHYGGCWLEFTMETNARPTKAPDIEHIGCRDFVSKACFPAKMKTSECFVTSGPRGPCPLNFGNFDPESGFLTNQS